MVLMEGFDIYIAKHHMAQHLLDRMSRPGNPVLYQNFLDESLNKDLKAVCGNISQLNFEETLLFKMDEKLKRISRKRKH